MNLYINLPVKDLEEATKFYLSLGFIKHDNFSDDNATGLSYKDEFYVMLLTHDFTKQFMPHKEIADTTKTSEVLHAIQVENIEAVDTFISKAINAWWNEFRPTSDYWFMYSRAFEDVDGHIRETFSMDMSKMPQE